MVCVLVSPMLFLVFSSKSFTEDLFTVGGKKKPRIMVLLFCVNFLKILIKEQINEAKKYPYIRGRTSVKTEALKSWDFEQKKKK